MSLPLPYQYLREDESITFHAEDNRLDTITIKLPKLDEWYSKILKRPVSYEEALTFVDGYGLAPKDQKFKHQVMPQKLKVIYERVFAKLRATDKTNYHDISDVQLEDIYEEISSHTEYYKEEIKWIKLQIKRRYVGYWFFCKGKPTYLNGANYFFLNFWKVKNEGRNGNLPDYRSYQRGMFHLLMYAYTTTDAIYKHVVTFRDENGELQTIFKNGDLREAVEELRDRGLSYFVKKDVYATVDKKTRTVNGVNFVSGRRVAKTAITCCFGYVVVTNKPEQTFIIQAMNYEHAKKKVFVKQVLIPFSTLPFFFRPFQKGREEKASGFEFSYEGSMAAAHRAGVVPDPLNSFVTPMASTEKAADGEEIHFIYRDEPGKKPDEKAAEQNIPTWWYNTIKPATERGDEIIGFAVLPTTVGNMDAGGGSQFLDIVKSSHFAERDDNGCTPSGLINFLMPGYYAIPGFIDEYGDTVIDDPAEPVLSDKGKWITVGAKRWLQNKKAFYEKHRMFKELTQLKQNYPENFDEAFSVTPEEMGMPIREMQDRIAELKFRVNQLTTDTAFEWVDTLENGVVRENVKAEKRLWKYSYIPSKEHWNKRTVVDESDGYIKSRKGGPIFAPDSTVANKFVLCFDPVKFHNRNKKGTKSSTPSAVIYYKRDTNLDPDGKPRSEWISQDYVAYLLFRTEDKDEVYEEILKAAILYGAYIYPEWPDAEDFVEWVRDKGYDGYLLRDMNEKNQLEKWPGVWAGAETKQDMATKMATWFKQNVRHMKIWQIIEDWIQMRGLDDLTNHDLAAASGWCQRAAAQKTGDVFQEMYQGVVIEDGFQVFET